MLSRHGDDWDKDENLDNVRKVAKHHKDLAFTTDAAFSNKQITTIQQDFDNLSLLFNPNTFGYLDAIRGQKQQDQFASKYIEQIKEIGNQYCIGLLEAMAYSQCNHRYCVSRFSSAFHAESTQHCKKRNEQ